jgi:hypothetical protein
VKNSCKDKENILDFSTLFSYNDILTTEAIFLLNRPKTGKFCFIKEGMHSINYLVS